MKHARLRVVLGAAAILALLPLYAALHLGFLALGKPLILLDMLYFFVFACALYLLGVLRPARAPLSYAPTPALLVPMLCYGVTIQDASTPIQQWIWMEVAPLGHLLLMLSLLFLIRGLIFERARFRFDIPTAVVVFALVGLACFQPLAAKNLRSIAFIDRYKNLWLGTVYAFATGALLIPFLKRSRAGGLVLVCIGAVWLAVYFIMTYSSLGRDEPSTSWGNILKHALQQYTLPRDSSFIGALLLGGLWCIFSGKKDEEKALPSPAAPVSQGE